MDKLLLIMRLFPVKTKPEAPLKETAPLKREVPAPATWLIADADKVVAVTLFAEVIVISPRGFIPPTTPEKVMFPSPENRFIFCVPFTVLENKMSPTPLPELKLKVPPKVKGLLKVMFCPLVEREKVPAKFVGPGPLSKKEELVDKVAPDPNVKVPE